MMAANKLTLSIIIPTFNSGNIISHILDSILKQVFTDYEILIIDNVSGDNTTDIVRRYASTHNNIRLISKPDKGIYDAMNKGICMAGGEWLYFIGSDDILYDEFVLDKIFQLKLANYQVIYGNVLFKHSGEIYDNKFNWYKLLIRNICHQAIFYRACIFEHSGFYNTRYKYLADWEFNMRWFSDKTIKRKFIKQTIAVYNEDGSCFGNTDYEFQTDFDLIIKRYFTFLKRIVWRHREQIVLNKLLPLLFRV